ncbi:MAG: nitric oxide reductase activation protein [Gammaproteobacteria bacterium HGW-Gammaproteobacteria-1]|jgi:nitric oxide reductase NorD protein|nr:MAG: nitric oxide reductase activation protein [Gammaproteobacteria bacterium HGW-Gammaproteobacteria-1]
MTSPSRAEQIAALLDDYLETEFTFIRTESLVQTLVTMAPAELQFVLDWTRRIASTNTEIAHQFVLRAAQASAVMEPRMIEAWALHAMDVYDRAGLRPALEVIRDVDAFMQRHHEKTAGAVFQDVERVLLPFIHGLAGRRLKLELGDAAYTDSETIFLPALLARLPTVEENFRLYKATAVMLWAQTSHGTFRAPLPDDLDAAALARFHVLETWRLEALIARRLPGLGREMLALKQQLHEDVSPAAWAEAVAALQQPEATAHDSLDWSLRLAATELPSPLCYQGELRLHAVAERMQARIDREKLLFRVRLAEWLREQAEKAREQQLTPGVRAVPEERASTGDGFELTLNEIPVAPPETLRQLATSIVLDLGEIPDEYLVPAGPGEYDPTRHGEQAADPDAMWQGTYHEIGAVYYNEWDYGRQHYRKNWCVMREKDVAPVYDGFIADTLSRYSGLVAHLRRSFEAMRDEERVLKRQAWGDDVDIDALVEALADARDGSEMSDRLFTRLHRVERNIAVAFMVDMSGSTRGWINDAERESLLLLCEALEALGDRYAIYGFSGITRKRCELYRIKRFDEPYGDEVRARISGVRPQDYTRMGFAVRHLSKLLNETEARTRLLITLSDGKPDDYSDYRGVYGIEDTRRALIEARRSGIHPFCITIDEHGPEYLPHMYGAVNYAVVDEVRQLPLKVADIYRRLTT